jgi:hypothetical protein
VRVKLAGILAFLVLLSVGSSARAEHEIYYRYVVLGYVQDGDGKPREGVEIRLTREKTGLMYGAISDAAGLYVVVARLGDESAGERLRLHQDRQELVITARFDPADHERERGTRVDFVRGRPVERAAEFHPTLRRVLGQ